MIYYFEQFQIYGLVVFLLVIICYLPVLYLFYFFLKNKEPGTCDVNYRDGFLVRIYDWVLWGDLGLDWRVGGSVGLGNENGM